MQKSENLELVARIERLERANRRLTLLSGAMLLVPVVAIAGWQDAVQAPAVPDVIRARKIEVVDGKGVPMVSLTTGRNDEGGAMTLRDKTGERRGWWTSSPEGSSLALVKEKDAKMEGSNTAGFSVTPSSAEMNLIGPQNAMFSSTVKDDQPRLELWNSKGSLLFSAPWKTPKSR